MLECDPEPLTTYYCQLLQLRELNGAGGRGNEALAVNLVFEDFRQLCAAARSF
jgi:hypothetical protein